MHCIYSLRNLLIVFIVSAVVIPACTRISSTELGRDLIPSIDGVNTLDTLLDVITETYETTDTTRIYNGDNLVIGNITNDPLFGRTRASLYFELKPESYPYTFAGVKDSIVVDSAVLILGYKGFYGDSTQPLRLTVHEISQNTPLQTHTTYAADHPNVIPVQTAGQLAPPVTVDIRRLGDSVNNRFEAAVNQIRIKLNQTVARRFILNYDTTNAYKNDSIFRTYFAGFGITADAGLGNALLKVNMADTNTKFALYYSSSSTGATVRDTSVVYFKFNTSTSPVANFVVRDRSGSEVAQHFATATSPKPDSLVYVQTSPGTHVRIIVPGLAGLTNRLVHRAELIAEQVPDDANLLTTDRYMSPPRYLLLSIYDSVDKVKRNIPNDYTMSTSGSNIAEFGGFLNYRSVPGYDRIGAYYFTLTRYVQGIVTRKDTSFTLRLSAPANDSLMYFTPYPYVSTPTVAYLTPSAGNDPADGRVRLGGGTHSRFRMRLRVIYSKL